MRLYAKEKGAEIADLTAMLKDTIKAKADTHSKK